MVVSLVDVTEVEEITIDTSLVDATEAIGVTVVVSLVDDIALATVSKIQNTKFNVHIHSYCKR